jgi:DNA-directed RNA polymerase specialized sigma subunit
LTEFIRKRNREIVRMIDEDLMTATAVAKWFNISKQRVSQIYNREKQHVQDIRTPGDGQDNDTTQHGRQGS